MCFFPVKKKISGKCRVLKGVEGGGVNRFREEAGREREEKRAIFELWFL